MLRLIPAIAFLAITAGPLAAQGGNPAHATSKPSAGPKGFVREVFVYPEHHREDPVAPPSMVEGKGPQSIALRGIMLDVARPALSSAIIEIGAASGGRRVRQVVKAGDRVDQFHVVRVEARRVVLRQSTLGATKLVALTRESGLMELPR
jgi:hypothetical protein